MAALEAIGVFDAFSADLAVIFADLLLSFALLDPFEETVQQVVDLDCAPLHQQRPAVFLQLNQSQVESGLHFSKSFRVLLEGLVVFGADGRPIEEMVVQSFVNLLLDGSRMFLLGQDSQRLGDDAHAEFAVVLVLQIE